MMQYLSIAESLTHAGIANNVDVDIMWIDSVVFEENDDAAAILKDADGVIVPGGFGERGIEGKIKAITYCRENKVPYLGICLGMQLAIIEFARNVLGHREASSTEHCSDTAYPVIDLMPETEEHNRYGRHNETGKLQVSS